LLDGKICNEIIDIFVQMVLLFGNIPMAVNWEDNAEVESDPEKLDDVSI